MSHVMPDRPTAEMLDAAMRVYLATEGDKAPERLLRLYRVFVNAAPATLPPEAGATSYTLVRHWALALETYNRERSQGRAESYAMREALMVIGDAIDRDDQSTPQKEPSK